MKVVSIVGARPQFVKAGIVSRELRNRGVREIFVHTGQHYDFEMSEVFFRELNLPEPDYYLGVGSGTHGEQTGRMLIEIEKVLLKENPDVVLVYGDTNSTLAGALAAAKLHIDVAHVEAGLRSYNMEMPEEINRVLTDHISKFLFAPTETAVKNLKREGIEKGVYLVGDVMYDVALEVLSKVDERGILSKWNLHPDGYILVTIHRAENTDSENHLREIAGALRELSLNHNHKIFFPVHPRTRKKLEEYNLLEVLDVPNLILSRPVTYFEMVVLEKNAAAIITDSGGVQKEGFFFGTRCVIPRNETEWVELVETGWNILSGVKSEDIVKSTLQIISGDPPEIGKRFYGEGDASKKIAELLTSN